MLFTYDLDLLVFIHCVIYSTFASLNHSLAWNIQILLNNQQLTLTVSNILYVYGRLF